MARLGEADLIATVQRLGDSIAVAVSAYEQLCHAPQPTDPKDAQAHHAACKAALQHLEMLLKVFRQQPSNSDAIGQSPDDPTPLIDRARRALGKETTP